MAALVPPNLKPIQPFLKVAIDYDKRDAVVAYFCRMYAVQKGIKIDSKSAESKATLFGLMDQLEKTKKELNDEAVTNDIVAQSYLEDKVMKLFLWADTEDRAARFGKNVVKAFYTSSLLFEVLTMYGELSEELAKQQKYAKWKAAYILKCQKAGQTPVPGPQDDGEGSDYAGAYQPGEATGGESATPYPYPSQNTMPQLPTVPQPQQQPLPPIQPSPQPPPAQPAPSSSKAQLSPTENEKAQKLCRYAISALQYDDYNTAISNLEKALALVKTGQ